MGAVHPFENRNPSKYAARGERKEVYRSDSDASFAAIRVTLGVFAEQAPHDYCPYPASRLVFVFGRYSISCPEHRDALLALAKRFEKPVNNNISGFHLPSRSGGYSKKNATAIDDQLLAFEL